MKSKIRINRLSLPLSLTTAIAAMMTGQAAHAQTISWTNTGSTTAWYTNTNWNPNTSSSQWLTTNIAQFNNTGTATTAGINMGTASLSIGAIEISSLRTRALTIGNSSATAGTLTLNGATVNSVNNVILRNASNSLLTLQNNETGSGKTMNIVLANATNNIIQIDGSGGVTISSNISGSGRQLTRQGDGTGALTLSGNNTFDGGLNFTGAAILALQHSNAAGTGTINIASTRASNDTAAIMTLAGGINVANDIVIDSATGRNTINAITSGSNTLSGDITINNNGSGNQIVFQNQVNNSTLTIGAATPNSTTFTAASYSGSISFRAGTSSTNAVGVINSQINAPNATFNLNNNGVWTVNSTGNSWASTTLSTAGSRIILGANDALATGAQISTGSVAASVNLNGFNQSVAGLVGSSSTAEIFNGSSSTDSTLTLAGLAADRAFSGAITDGSGGKKTSLVVNISTAFVQTLSGTNTFTGTTTVTAGTLLVNGSLASGSAVTVETNGILGGNGTVNGTLAINGKVAPGGVGTDIKTLNAGATTWNGGGVLNFDLATTGTTSDKLNITGDFIKGSAGTYEFNFMGSTPAWGTTFTLVEWSGDLTGFDIDASDFSHTGLGTGSYSTSYFTITGKTLQFTAIPEPTSALAGLLLGFGLLRRRRQG